MKEERKVLFTEKRATEGRTELGGIYREEGQVKEVGRKNEGEWTVRLFEEEEMVEKGKW